MQSYEIFKKEWVVDGEREGIDVALSFTDSWDIQIAQCETGASVERTYGDRDYEQWVIVQRADAPRLIRILLQYAFNQNEPLELRQLARILEREGLMLERGSWA